MSTLILSPRYTTDSDALWQAAIHAGWSIRRLQSWRIDSLPDENIAVYAEPLFVAAIAQQIGLVMLEPPFDWLPQLPKQYRKRDVFLAQLQNLHSEWFPAFIKPADDKCFPAKVYTDPDDFPVTDLLAPTTPVLVSEPVVWEIEFRCFILERKCVTSSVYARYGNVAQAVDGSWPVEEHEADGARAFINILLADEQVHLPPSVVIDIGRIKGRGWAVIEANPAWGSGIYGCDPSSVLMAIARGCRTLQMLSDEDKKWIIERADAG